MQDPHLLCSLLLWSSPRWSNKEFVISLSREHNVDMMVMPIPDIFLSISPSSESRCVGTQSAGLKRVIGNCECSLSHRYRMCKMNFRVFPNAPREPRGSISMVIHRQIYPPCRRPHSPACIHYFPFPLPEARTSVPLIHLLTGIGSKGCQPSYLFEYYLLLQAAAGGTRQMLYYRKWSRCQIPASNGFHFLHFLQPRDRPTLNAPSWLLHFNFPNFPVSIVC